MIQVRIVSESATAYLTALPTQVRRRVSDTVKRLTYQEVNVIRAAYDAAGLHSRSGALKGSIQPGEFTESDTEITGKVVAGGGDEFYAAAQEYGAHIVAKNVSFLTIPVGEALTPMGVSRFTARQVISSPQSYGYTGTFFRHGVLFGEQAVSGRRGHGTLPGVEPLFILKQSVDIPERSYMRAGLTQFAPVVVEQLGQAVVGNT